MSPEEPYPKPPPLPGWMFLSRPPFLIRTQALVDITIMMRDEVISVKSGQKLFEWYMRRGNRLLRALCVDRKIWKDFENKFDRPFMAL